MIERESDRGETAMNRSRDTLVMGSIGALLGVLSEADPTRRLLHAVGIAILLLATVFRRRSPSPFVRAIVPAWLFTDIALRNVITAPGRPRLGLTPAWIALAVLYAFAFLWIIRDNRHFDRARRPAG